MGGAGAGGVVGGILGVVWVRHFGRVEGEGLDGG